METYSIFAKLKSVPREYRDNPLWDVVVELAKSMPLYSEHKAYIRDVVLLENPCISIGELSALLRIPLGEAMVILSELRMWREDVEEEIMKELPKPSYRRAAVGGTFNELHYGHFALIYTALKNSEKVIIGVTGDEFVKILDKKYSPKSFEERVRNLKSMLSSKGWLDRCEIVMLNDPYGPTIVEPDLDLLVVSPMTYSRAIEINDIRLKKGLKPLEVIVCPLVVAEDCKPISSTRIVLGEIDLTGRIVKKS
ncbi:MAG: pantetheine-phosphate adenylyltransferase [Aigarchaeota archaeon]|nr:pantetheine-phosphate adenylyltransferase [Aigarchaeota archaeon]MDW7986701.1 pantetheine-phosphate adenylyltransferase [Nitrososphaerota archaeon]